MALDSLLGSRLTRVQSGKFRGNSKELGKICEDIIEQWAYQMDGWNEELSNGENHLEQSTGYGMVGMNGDLEMDIELENPETESAGNQNHYFRSSIGESEGMSIDDQEESWNEFNSSNGPHQSLIDSKPKGTGASKYAHDGPLPSYNHQISKSRASPSTSTSFPFTSSNYQDSNRNDFDFNHNHNYSHNSFSNSRRSPLTSSNSLPLVGNRYLLANQNASDRSHSSEGGSRASNGQHGGGINASRWAH